MSSYSYSGQCKERDGKHREAGCHDFPHPGLRNRVTVPSIFISVSNDLSELGPCLPDSCDSDHPPPESVSVAVEVRPASGPNSVLE